MREARESYLESEDVLGQWFDERCEVGKFDWLTASSLLLQDWKEWCEANGFTFKPPEPPSRPGAPCPAPAVQECLVSW